MENLITKSYDPDQPAYKPADLNQNCLQLDDTRSFSRTMAKLSNDKALDTCCYSRAHGGRVCQFDFID